MATQSHLLLVAFFGLGLQVGSALADGACCFIDGTCQVLPAISCQQQLGSYQGDNTVCAPNPCTQPPPNDTCHTPSTISRCTAGTLLGTTYLAHGDYDPGEPWPSCTGSHAYGPDVVYQMQLYAGDVVDLIFTPWRTDGAIYIVTDCANVARSCVAGADNNLYAQPEYLHYVAPTAGDYFVIIDGYYQYSAGEFDLAYNITCPSSETTESPISARTELMLPTPSPFRSSITLRYGLPEVGHVRVEVFDASGRLVQTLVDGDRPAGFSSIQWDGRDREGREAAAGVYFARLVSSGRAFNQTMVKIR